MKMPIFLSVVFLAQICLAQIKPLEPTKPEQPVPPTDSQPVDNTPTEPPLQKPILPAEPMPIVGDNQTPNPMPIPIVTPPDPKPLPNPQPLPNPWPIANPQPNPDPWEPTPWPTPPVAPVPQPTPQPISYYNSCGVLFSTTDMYHTSILNIEPSDSIPDLSKYTLGLGNWNDRTQKIEAKAGCVVVAYQNKNYNRSADGYKFLVEARNQSKNKSQILSSPYAVSVSSLQCFCK